MNPNPSISDANESRTKLVFIDGRLDKVNKNTVFELLRDIQDPEHPYSIERLEVIKLDYIEVGVIEKLGNELKYKGLPLKYVDVKFRPTIPHCSMAGIIGLAIKYQLSRYTGPEYWVRVFIVEDTHVNWKALNKQLNDRDRVMAALENESMLDMLNSIVPILD